MQTITEQVEEIKSLVCEHICKWMDKANMTKYKTTEDIEKMSCTMQEICERCPLQRL